MSVKRDCEGLARAEDQGHVYVHFNIDDGSIYGSSYTMPSGDSKYPKLCTMSLSEYRFWTSRHKDVDVVTAMDWYNVTDFKKIFGVANVHIL